MPWSAEHYPPSMRHLSAAARDKAIAIANALLSEGMDEGKAIRIAISKAKEWASHHGLPLHDDEWP
jgi:uncharacterized protein YdaT